MQSKFNEDKRLEELFGRWLDKRLYPFLPIGSDSVFQRIHDEKYQKKGIDVVVRVGDSRLLIDEKATLHYINKNIPTFAFELLNRSSGAQGWLYNRSYLTTHYLLAWPNATDPGNISDIEDFTFADVMLIERVALIELLAHKGLTEDTLRERVDFYSSRVTRRDFKFSLSPGINLIFTQGLAEKPVNIVIGRNLLDKIAVFHKRIH